MQKVFCLVSLCFLSLIYFNPSFSEEPHVSKEGQITGQSDLQEKKSTSPKQQALEQAENIEAKISIKDNPVRGNKNARLVLIEFTDFQ